MIKDVNFYKLDRIRKYFAIDNSKVDHVCEINTNSRVLISAPHAVSQVRLGKVKVSEIGSLKTVLWLRTLTNVSYIVKTKNNYDDANWDEKSKYKEKVFEVIRSNNVKYILDFHGLGAQRPCDINLGTNFGKNIEVDVKLFDKLVNDLSSAGFVVSIDQPFNAGNHTISGSSKIKYNYLWTLQVEINTNITNKAENFEKYKKIIAIFTDFINSISKD